MPTDQVRADEAAAAARAENERRMFQAVLQQAAQRKEQMSDAAKIAQIQADATLGAARIQAGAEDARQAALGKREAAAIEARKGMTEAEKANLGMMQEDRALDPKRMLMRELMGDSDGVGKPTTVAAPTADTKQSPQPIAPKPSYDMTGFNRDVADIAANVATARNQSNGPLSYDDMPEANAWTQGASIRGADGKMRQVAWQMPSKPVPATAMVDDGVKAAIAAAAAKAQSAPAPAASSPAPVQRPKPIDFAESREGKLSRLAGVQPPLADRVGERRAMQAQADIDAASKALMSGDYAGEAGKQKLIGIIKEAGGEVPGMIAAGQTADIGGITGSQEFQDAVASIRDTMSAQENRTVLEGDSDNEAFANLVAKRINAKAQDISAKTGVPASVVAKELASQASAGQRGVNKGFFPGLFNVLGEIGTLGYAETSKENMIKNLREQFFLDEYNRQKASK